MDAPRRVRGDSPAKTTPSPFEDWVLGVTTLVTGSPMGRFISVGLIALQVEVGRLQSELLADLAYRLLLGVVEVAVRRADGATHPDQQTRFVGLALHLGDG